jgi:hypothetical protein
MKIICKNILINKIKWIENKIVEINKKRLRRLVIVLPQIIKKKINNSNIIMYKNILNKKIKNEKKLLLLILEKKSNYFNLLILKQYLKITICSFLIAKQYKQGINNIKLLLLNNYKFQNFFLIYLKELIKRIYNKDVEFKIINLKKLHLNNDIFLQSIALKVKKRQYVLKVFKKVLKLVKLSYLNQYLKKSYGKDIELKKNFLIKKDKNTYFNKIFIYDNLFDNIAINVFNSVKHKFIIGVRLEAQGRLTKRLTASRSIFKFKSKGNIKNIDSSYKGISTVILKGNTKSNIQYTLINSNTPNGSFGLRG